MANNDWDVKPPYGRSTKVSPETALNLASLLQQSIPTGVEGDTRSEVQRYSDAFDQPEDPRLSRALMTYGNRVIVPSLSEIPGAVGGGVLDGLNTAGDIAMAYGPPNLGPAGPAAVTLGMLLKSPQAAARVLSRLAPTVEGAEVGATSKAPSEALSALSDQVTAARAARAQRKTEAYQAANPNMGPTVPKVDGVTPVRERNQVVDTIQSNPYTQAVPGRQGFPTKAEQTKLAQQYFDNGGRLSQGGPWGRDMQQEIRNVLAKAAKKADNQSTGPMVNKPGSQEMGKGLDYFRDQARNAESEMQQEVFKRYQIQRRLSNLKNGIDE